MTVYRDRMEARLRAALAPLHLIIEDQSARHAGHAGHDPRGETHFRAVIVSDAFAGMSRLTRHRMVYAALRDELKERIHALSVEAYTQEEYNHK